jgi:hypothetical protein
MQIKNRKGQLSQFGVLSSLPQTKHHEAKCRKESRICRRIQWNSGENAPDADAFEAGAQNLAGDDAPATCNDLVVNHVKTAVLVGSDDP